ncbi:2'-5' RNA ligase family protein [Dyella sp. C11]|uniref:2'-5' RNA ligase family protein n=1 Tax=Dyella sp. C11 TaxID=2126991 RepID=UPI000D64F37D|nr:2'-5' RNA ligase family protein [Dyella sp. C11]
MAGGDLFGLSGDEGLAPECNYFFALMPAGIALQQIGERRAHAVREAQELRPSPVEDHRLHLTLCTPKSLKRLRAPFEESLKRAGDDVTAAAFGLRLDGFEKFTGGYGQACLVLRSDGETGPRAQALKDAIGEALFKHGFGWDKGALSPHVTLYYANDVALPDSVGQPVDWQVDEFVLIRSHVGKHRHDVIGRWPLAAAA